MPIGKNSKGEWVGGGRRHDHPPPLPPSATDAERQKRGAPEGTGPQWRAPTLPEEGLKPRPSSMERVKSALMEVEKLAHALTADLHERLRATELALEEANTARTTLVVERDQLAQRLEAMGELRAREAQEAVRSMSILHKDWASDLRKAAEGLDAALKKGHALATEDAARWLEDDVLGPGNMSEWSRMPPYLHGRIRAGEHLARDVGQDPAKEPV